MKTANIKLSCEKILDTHSIVSQLNNLAAHKNVTAAPFSRFLHAASKESSTGIAVTLVDCTKKEAVIALRDMLRTYKCFHVTGRASFYDPLTKRDIKLISLPISSDDQETVDKLNLLCHAKFTLSDLSLI